MESIVTRGSYLSRREGTYYARIDVPTDLVPALGKETLKKSLKTKDLKEAKRSVLAVVSDWHRLFEITRSRLGLSDSDRDHAVWDHYRHSLDIDEAERSRLPTQADVEAETARLFRRVEAGEIKGTDPLSLLDATLELKFLQNAATVSQTARKAKLAELKRHLAIGETVLVADAVDDFLEGNKFLIERSTPEWISLARRLMRAEIEALERTLERDAGDFTGQPRDALIHPPAQPPSNTSSVGSSGETIAKALTVFKKEYARTVSKSRVDEACRDIGVFIQTVGPDIGMAALTKKHVRVWKELLTNYPVRATEVVELRDLTIAQAVAANEHLKRPVLSDRTVNRYLSSLSAFFSWAVKNGYMAENPCWGMSLPKERSSKTLPFTIEQMNHLFASPLFNGAESDSEWRLISKPGRIKIRDHRFWVPLIMLFSGARPGEIGQLAVSDVREEHGHWIMHITTEGDTHEQGKSVKTEGSMRVVPIHPELIHLGFIKYHSERKAAGDRQLFPGATRNERGQMMSDFSREFGKYLIRIGLKVGRGLSLYSFRHGATDAFRRAGHLDEQFRFLLGHTKGTTTQRYGLLPQGMLEDRVALIRSISYPGLNLKHLLPPP
jgi:integrase